MRHHLRFLHHILPGKAPDHARVYDRTHKTQVLKKVALRCHIEKLHAILSKVPGDLRLKKQHPAAAVFESLRGLGWKRKAGAVLADDVLHAIVQGPWQQSAAKNPKPQTLNRVAFPKSARNGEPGKQKDFHRGSTHISAYTGRLYKKLYCVTRKNLP